jgi:anti-anti-sigma factor
MVAEQLRHESVVVLSGDIGVEGTGWMRAQMLAELQGPARDMRVDLQQVRSLSPAGMAVLVGVRARQRAWDQKLTLVCSRDSAAGRALAQSGMARGFQISWTASSPSLTGRSLERRPNSADVDSK